MDVVLTDVVMPGMNGIELADTIKERWTDVPVILATGYSDELIAKRPEYPSWRSRSQLPTCGKQSPRRSGPNSFRVRTHARDRFVQTYRLYCLGGKDEITASHWIRASTDEEAVERAKIEHPGSHCELWYGTKLVAAFRTEYRLAERVKFGGLQRVALAPEALTSALSRSRPQWVESGHSPSAAGLLISVHEAATCP